MHFALLGNHPDGLALSAALVETGRYHLAAYSGPTAGAEELRRRGLTVKPVADVEEVLADPVVEMVIVACGLSSRPGLLRRALQSERHVLCVHPADVGPDVAYEAAMIQGDTHKVLLPLLPEALHPAIGRLTELIRQREGPLGIARLIEMERWSPGSLWLESGPAVSRPTLPIWGILRALGGEIAEVSSFAASEEPLPDASLLLSGQFERGGLFQATLLPDQYEQRWRLKVIGTHGAAELTFESGWPGPTRLSWRDHDGQAREEAWPSWNPWPALVEQFEQAVQRADQIPSGAPTPLSWQDAVRCLELDDAARRSVARRRASSLEYPEASEEAGFKGTMTLVGCGLLWAILLLLILSAWIPWLAWAILPVLVIFLGLQLLRWLIPNRRPTPGPTPHSEQGDPVAERTR